MNISNKISKIIDLQTELNPDLKFSVSLEKTTENFWIAKLLSNNGHGNRFPCTLMATTGKSEMEDGALEAINLLEIATMKLAKRSMNKHKNIYDKLKIIMDYNDDDKLSE